ncbi:hypothetical protein HGI30_15130 [Paenibacillus albicereus]|uniref:Uncharacterized protein n=1 Tax=Paenibacillus albicereus TaxID=2726185 RepID=A0A6H2GZD4_9BACL|nr:hypothetical protein [Paenibacillus albicereus]QJC52765.1 hypothetical protein HGI30_15130 [Paenibacillus albicereus]
MSRLKNQGSSGGRKISDKAIEVKTVSRPSICFHDMNDSVYRLSDIDKYGFELMLKQFKIMGSMTWNEIYSHKGFKWEEIPERSMKYAIPKSLNRTSLFHVKVSGKFRVWGYREDNVFHLVWIDPNHDVTA